MSGCEIWQQVFLKLPDNCFDGYPLLQVAPCERTAVAPTAGSTIGVEVFRCPDPYAAKCRAEAMPSGGVADD